MSPFNKVIFYVTDGMTLGNDSFSDPSIGTSAYPNDFFFVCRLFWKVVNILSRGSSAFRAVMCCALTVHHVKSTKHAST